jgi:adenine-specific DNA-methyltransferase
MDKMNMHTPNLADENFRKLAALFPNAVTETVNEQGEVVRAIDKDVLMQEISTTVVEGREERYQFTWPDKKKAVLAANAPISATLRPIKADSVGKDGTPGGWDSENLYIEGDNLDVLKLLRETYLGKVKMIYIDPPYNTGNDFVYEDDFAEDTDSYMGRSGQYDEQGNQLVQNTDRNGRFHTDWLNMIYPRLRIAKDLLAEDGAIFISIDENEVNTLKTVCDEVFSASNFIAELIWSAGRKNDSKYISVSHEYILCYFKDALWVKEHKILWREKKQGLADIYAEYDRLKKMYSDDCAAIEKDFKAWYKSLPDGHPAKDHAHYSRVDKNGIFFADNISWPGGGGPKYQVLHPVTQKPVKIPSRGWLTNEATMKEWIAQGRVEFAKDENGVPTLKSYLKDREYSVPYSVFYKDGRAASKRLATLMGDKVFENPKDEEIIQRIIQLCGTDDGDIIMDFFSGSATTAHALFLADAEQNKHRKFILVQLPETIDPQKEASEKARKVAQNAVNLLDSIGVAHNICEIGKERIRRAAKKIREDAGLTLSKDFDGGFRCLRLDSSNMQDVYYNPMNLTQSLLDLTADNIKPDRTPEDLLFQVMLELGVLPSSTIAETEIDGKRVFDVANGFLLACFDTGVTTETVTAIAKKQPYYAVFRDASMADDSTATNFDQIFETYSPSTVRKVL